jgi:hypothetical protein
MASQQGSFARQLGKKTGLYTPLEDFSGLKITMCRYTYLDPDEDLYSGSEQCGPIEV